MLLLLLVLQITVMMLPLVVLLLLLLLLLIGALAILIAWTVRIWILALVCKVAATCACNQGNSGRCSSASSPR